MDIAEAIRARHSVRRYVSKPIDGEATAALQEKIGEVNREGGLHVQLVTGERRAFGGFASYGKFTGVENYLVMAGKKSDGLNARIGYYGEQLVLLAQTLGLNTCWVGLTYRKVAGAFSLEQGEKVVCLIALGYGETQGSAHKTKTVEQVSNASADTPEWFRRGVEAALLAPTAINQQKFSFEYIAPHAGQKARVAARRGFSLAGYTQTDCGIAMLHFEIGAGVENFEWENGGSGKFHL